MQSVGHDVASHALGVGSVGAERLSRLGFSQSVQFLFQMRAERAYRLASVADGRFLFRRDFGERLAVRRIAEDRIVAESAGAGRLRGELPLDNAFGFERNLAARGKSEGAHESST